VKTHSVLRRSLGIAAAVIGCRAAAQPFDPVPELENCNVTWSTPGRGPADSMPLGNGDIGLNVWTDPGGDLLFYIGKTDAWTEDPIGTWGLAKLGRIRVHVDGRHGTTPFFQTLRLHEAEIAVTEGSGPDSVSYRVWVDANRPVIRVEVASGRPSAVAMTLEDWRTKANGRLGPDLIAPARDGRITWSHHNGADSDPHVRDWTFGAVVEGRGLRNLTPSILETAGPVSSQLISVHPLTLPAAPESVWRAMVNRLVDANDSENLESARREHRAWWDLFWHRSWIFVAGGAGAREVTEGYVLQRFVTACAGRGAYPIKFNGSLFVVDQPAENVGGQHRLIRPVSADFRMWGGCYWFQNTRAMYWPRLMAGDFDEMQPLFRMYLRILKANAPLVRRFYHHEGSYSAETTPFLGGLKDISHNGRGYYGDDYYTGMLELTMMGLDYWEYTGDRALLRHTVLPIARDILAFFDGHFPRDKAGRLLLDPDNAIETFWKVRNPAPDIAGLHAVLDRLLALPEGMVDDGTLRQWRHLRNILPDLPIGDAQGHRVLLPYEGPQTAEIHNSENPELYAVYPFRLYGLGRPDLDIARDSFEARRVQTTGCWVQDPIQAALLGFTSLARADVLGDLTRRDPDLRFPAFWIRGNDYMPDEDNGGNGENALQLMLLQPVGGRLLPLPAWPSDWDADFRLNAPRQTVVEGRVRGGKLIRLEVTPAERRADVVLPGEASK
jgi:alpha-L-fucosidase 2